MSTSVEDLDHLKFLLHMKAKAKETLSRRRRKTRYSQEDKDKALDLFELVEAAGGDLEDAAELMSLHRATLVGWLDRATAATGEWGSNRSIHVTVNVSA